MNSALLSSLGKLILIVHQNNIEHALTIKNYLIHEKMINGSDIEIERISEPCEKQIIQTNLIGHFCVDKEGNLKILKLDSKNYERIYLNY